VGSNPVGPTKPLNEVEGLFCAVAGGRFCVLLIFMS
jgi:hypothetical protein